MQSELIGDLLGDSFVRGEFWQMLNEREPALFQRLGRAVVRWLDKVLDKLRGAGMRDYGSARHFSDLEKARNMVADALARFARTRDLSPEAQLGRGDRKSVV